MEVLAPTLETEVLILIPEVISTKKEKEPLAAIIVAVNIEKEMKRRLLFLFRRMC